MPPRKKATAKRATGNVSAIALRRPGMPSKNECEYIIDHTKAMYDLSLERALRSLRTQIESGKLDLPSGLITRLEEKWKRKLDAKTRNSREEANLPAWSEKVKKVVEKKARSPVHSTIVGEIARFSFDQLPDGFPTVNMKTHADQPTSLISGALNPDFKKKMKRQRDSKVEERVAASAPSASSLSKRRKTGSSPVFAANTGASASATLAKQDSHSDSDSDEDTFDAYFQRSAAASSETNARAARYGDVEEDAEDSRDVEELGSELDDDALFADPIFEEGSHILEGNYHRVDKKNANMFSVKMTGAVVTWGPLQGVLRHIKAKLEFEPGAGG
jgi:hypothetical protein